MRLEQLTTEHDSVQKHLAAERDKHALVAVAPAARQAVKLEILPQIEEGVFSVESAEELCADAKRALEAAFAHKNPLYTRLISHKGIEQGDGQFLTDMLSVMDEWLRSTKDSLGRKDGDSSSDKQEVEVVVKVDEDAVSRDKPEDTDSEDKQEIVLREEDDGICLEVGADSLLELLDLRL